jgi:O-antigen ligase
MMDGMTRISTGTLAASAAIAGFGGLIYAESYVTGISLAAPLIVLGLWVVVAAAFGRPWAIKCIVAAAIVFISTSFRIRARSEITVDAPVIGQLALYGICLFVAVGNLRTWWPRLGSLPAAAVCTYVLFGIASAAWSAIPPLSLGTACGELAVFLLAMTATARLGIRGTLQAVAWGLGVHLVLAVTTMLLAPQLAFWVSWDGSVVRLKGLTHHPYELADVSNLFMLCAIVLYGQRGLLNANVLLRCALAFPLVVLSDVRTALLALALAILSRWRARIVGLTAVAAIALLIVGSTLVIPRMSEAIGSLLSRSGEASEALTLTGRTNIWGHAIDLFSERPLLGWGYNVTRVLYGEVAQYADPSAQTPPHAHNTVLQSLVTLGILGTIPLIIVLVAQLAYVIRHPEGPVTPFIVYVLTMAMMSVAGVGKVPNAVAFVWMVAAVAVSMRPEQSQADAAEARASGARPALPRPKAG